MTNLKDAKDEAYHRKIENTILDIDEKKVKEIIDDLNKIKDVYDYKDDYITHYALAVVFYSEHIHEDIDNIIEYFDKLKVYHFLNEDEYKDFCLDEYYFIIKFEDKYYLFEENV